MEDQVTSRKGLVSLHLTTPQEKRYALGSWEDWETKTRETTKDPRGDLSYAVEGFSALASPYKETGEAKTIGEMLYEGAQGVRGSRAKGQELERKGELAILESQGGRMLSDEERAFKAEQAALERASKEKIAKEKVTEQELKRIPLARLITEIEKSSPDLKNAVPGSFQHTYSPGIATGRAIKRRRAADGIAVGVIEAHRWVEDPTKTSGWDYKADNMSSTIPWFDPVQHRWHVFNDDGNGMATGDPVKSFLTVDEAIAYIKGGHQEIIEERETLEENNAKEENKKQTKKPYTQKDYDESIVSGQDVIDVVTNPKTWEGTVAGNTRGYGVNQNIAQKATGGRVNYAEGSVDPLDDLKAWWKEQAWNPKDEG